MRKVPFTGLPRILILFLILLFSMFLSQAYAQNYIAITLEWEPVDGADGYLLYYGDDSRHNPENTNPYNGKEAIEGDSPIDVGNVTQFTIQIPDDDAYFIAVATVNYDKDYPYSDFSKEEATLCITWPEEDFWVNDEPGSPNYGSPYTVRGRAEKQTEVELYYDEDIEENKLGEAAANDSRDWQIPVYFESEFVEGPVILIVKSKSSGVVSPEVVMHYDPKDPSSRVTSAEYSNGFFIIKWSASDLTSGLSSAELWCKKEDLHGNILWDWTDTNLRRNYNGLENTQGIFYYRLSEPESQEYGTYYFATRAKDRANNWETGPSGEGDISFYYTDPADPGSRLNGYSGAEGSGGGCFISAAAPEVVSGQ